jgi:hypothetical protein
MQLWKNNDKDMKSLRYPAAIGESVLQDLGRAWLKKNGLQKNKTAPRDPGFLYWTTDVGSTE